MNQLSIRSIRSRPETRMPIAATMNNHPSASKKIGNLDSGATKISMGPITRRTITAKGNVDFLPQAALTQLVSVCQETPLSDGDLGATGERATFIHYKSNRNGTG